MSQPARYPQTIEPARAWLTEALCASPLYEGRRDLWFPTTGDKSSAREAKQVCVACPARLACLTDALREEGGRGHESRFGIRGGLSGKARRNLYDRNRARQARQEAAA